MHEVLDFMNASKKRVISTLVASLVATETSAVFGNVHAFGVHTTVLVTAEATLSELSLASDTALSTELLFLPLSRASFSIFLGLHLLFRAFLTGFSCARLPTTTEVAACSRWFFSSHNRKYSGVSVFKADAMNVSRAT
jgi:hypothetical protein